MNIQDLTRQQAAQMLSDSDLPILLGYAKQSLPVFGMDNKVPFPADPRFIIPNISPYTRRLELVRENDEVLVGVFSVPENHDRPYPLCAQYSLYMVDKKNPGRDCGGGVIGCQVPYPPVRDRTKGMDRVDYVRVQEWINDCLGKSGFSSRFPIDPGESYHRYWADEDVDSIQGESGTEKRGKDGAMRVLEYTRQNESVYVEVVSMPERFTEHTDDQPCYSIDFFRPDGRIITGTRIQSAVVWPPLRNRRFGMDYQDYVYTQQAINQVIAARGWGAPFDVDYDKERPCYFAKDRELNEIIVMKRRVADANIQHVSKEKMP